jgi:hypothetical protein
MGLLAEVAIAHDAQSGPDVYLIDQFAWWGGRRAVDRPSLEPVNGRGEQFHNLRHGGESNDAQLIDRMSRSFTGRK